MMKSISLLFAMQWEDPIRHYFLFMAWYHRIIDTFFQNNLIRRLTQPNLYSSRRTSIRSDNNFDNNLDTIWDIENQISNQTPKSYGRRRTLSPVQDYMRRGSKWTIGNATIGSDSGSQQINVSMNPSGNHPPIRGLRPSQIEDIKRRRSSALLRKSLQFSDHSPYSVWPASRPRTQSSFQVSPIRRRTSPRLSTHFETTDF